MILSNETYAIRAPFVYGDINFPAKLLQSKFLRNSYQAPWSQHLSLSLSLHLLFLCLSLNRTLSDRVCSSVSVGALILESWMLEHVMVARQRERQMHTR